MRKVKRLPIVSTRLSYAVENNGKFDEYVLPHLYPQAIKPDQYIMDYLRKKFPGEDFELVSPPHRDDQPNGGALQVESIPLEKIPMKDTTKATLQKRMVTSTICELNVNSFGGKFRRFLYSLADLAALPVEYEDRWGVMKRMSKWQSFRMHVREAYEWFLTLFKKDSYFRDIAPVKFLGVTVTEDQLEEGYSRLAKGLDALADRNLIHGTLALPMTVELVNTIGNDGKILVILCYVAIYPEVSMPMLNELMFTEGGIPAPLNGNKMPYSELKGEVYDIAEDL